MHLHPTSPVQAFWKQAHDTIAGIIRLAVGWVFHPAPKTAGRAFFRPALEVLGERIAPAVLVWNPDVIIGNNKASVIGNWSDETGNRLKGGAAKFDPLKDTYVFDNRSANATCNWDFNNKVMALKIQSGYGVPNNPGTINLLQDLQVNGSFVCEATNVVFSSMANSKIDLGPAGNGVTVTWAGNSEARVPVTFGTGVTATLSGGSKAFASTVTVNGNISWTQGNMTVNQVIVSNGGVFTVKDNLTLYNGAAGANIVNNGTFQRSAGNGQLIIYPTFENKGKFIVGTGEVQLVGIAKQTGVAASTLLDTGTKLTRPGTPQFMYTYTVDGGTVTARDQTTFTGLLKLTNATLNVWTKTNDPSTFNISGALNMQANSALGIVLKKAQISQVNVTTPVGFAKSLTIAAPSPKVKFYIAQGANDTPVNGQKTFLTWNSGRAAGDVFAWEADKKTWTVGNVKGKITKIAPLDTAPKNPQKAYAVTVESKGFNLPPPPGNGAGKVDGQVWLDDNDGVFGAGEAVAAGVSVYLLDSASNIVAATQTAADGTYQFSGLAEGTYWLTADLPATALFAARYTGNDPLRGQRR